MTRLNFNLDDLDYNDIKNEVDAMLIDEEQSKPIENTEGMEDILEENEEKKDDMSRSDFDDNVIFKTTQKVQPFNVERQ